MGLKNFWRRLTATPDTTPAVPADPWDSPEGDQMMSHMWGSNPALAAEVNRGRERHNAENAGLLHAHEITGADAAIIRMMAGSHWGDDAEVTLPSGKTITGAEMRRWVESQ